MKPLSGKAYGSIPHLPGSRRGPGDHGVSPQEAKLYTDKCRKGEHIIVALKYDGICMSVAKRGGSIIPLNKAGYRADSSQYLSQQMFHRYILRNYSFWEAIIPEGYRIVGEWLAQSVGTVYDLKDMPTNISSSGDISESPFIPFDLIDDKGIRCLYHRFTFFCGMYHLNSPQIVSIGDAISVDDAMKKIRPFDEGLVYRREDKDGFISISKFVRHDKIDGKYLPECNDGVVNVWNKNLRLEDV